MSHRIEQSSPCRVLLTATLAAERVGAEREKVVAEWMRRVRIDGFRKGKSPRHLVEHRYAKEIEDDLTERLVHTVWDEVRAEDTLRPAGPLRSARLRGQPDGSFEVSAELDVFPKVELPRARRLQGARGRDRAEGRRGRDVPRRAARASGAVGAGGR